MRVKSDRQGYFSWQPETRSKIVSQYEDKFHRISETLDATPEILDLVDIDLRRLSRPGQNGRKATFTSENLLRAMIVHQLERLSLRRTQITISHSPFLQGFLRLGYREAPDYSTLDRAIKKVRPETWERVNSALTAHAHDNELIDPSTLRVDSTLVESTIHYPTDGSLMWDSFRTLYRLLDKARKIAPSLIWQRFHEKKTKNGYLYITRYTNSKSKKRQRSVKKKERRFIDQVARIIEVSDAFAVDNSESIGCEVALVAAEIRDYLPAIRKVLDATKRVWLKDEKVPARDRVFSIFEPHVELVKRGRRHKPVEFGHMILLGQSREKFITQYDVMEKKISDSKLPQGIIDKHIADFGSSPDTFVADTGFRGKPDAMKALEDRVDNVSIPGNLKDWGDRNFVSLHHFRAGIEGSISVLKRAFGLLRCQYRGYKSFASHVGMGVFCHNLVILGAIHI